MSRAPKAPAARETKRCAVYTRKSTTMGLEQEFSSLDAQREACLAYIARQPGWIAVDMAYEDGGFSGANIDRPAFQRLLSDIEEGKVDVVVVYKVDRLSRSLLDFAKVMDRMSTAGASFVSITQNFSTADAMGRLTLNMLMSFAEFEREMISERTRDKIAASRRKGKWTGGPVPFGYDVKDKHLVVNELEAIVVRDAFGLFLQHGQMALVARTMNDRGQRPRRSSSSKGEPARWSKDGISRVLRNALYAGFITYGGELFPGEHAALIEQAVYDRAQRILRGAERDLKSRAINHDYILRGLLRCGQCHAAMSPGSTRKGTHEYRYYRCVNRDKGNGCTAPALPAAAIEKYVTERIVEATAGETFAAEAKAALATRLEARRSALATLTAKLPGAIATASANAAKAAEEITHHTGRAREVFEARLQCEGEKLGALEAQYREAQRDLDALEVEVVEAAWVARALADFKSIWAVLTPPNRGRLLRALVERVVVDEASGRVDVVLVEFGPGAGSPAPEPRAEGAAA